MHTVIVNIKEQINYNRYLNKTAFLVLLDNLQDHLVCKQEIDDIEELTQQVLYMNEAIASTKIYDTEDEDGIMVFEAILNCGNYGIVYRGNYYTIMSEFENWAELVDRYTTSQYHRPISDALNQQHRSAAGRVAES